MQLRCALALFLCTGCAGQVESSLQVTPPKPAPAAVQNAEAPPPDSAAPADADGDGVAAGDQCPDQKETANGYQDEDGCPDEVPSFYVKGNDIVFQGELAFGLLGGLLNSSQPTIDGIAELLKKQGELELIEVGAHLTDGSDQDNKSKTRAEAVVKALQKAGVDAKRLRAAGYGKRCPGDGSRVELKVVRKSGGDTGVELCGASK